MAFYLISFSPTGGTHRAAGLFAQSFSKECIPVDLTDRTLTFSGIPFSKQDICLAAVPAYGGRVPCPAAARLAQMHGGGARAILMAVYGSRAYEETVVLLSHKKADSYIHIDVEFGEGEGKIPVDSIAKRAEAYKPKEKVTYKMIKEYIEAKYGFKVHTAYIAEVKRDLGLPMYDAPNAVEELKQPRKHPTPEKVEAIKDALRYFAVI